MSDVTVTETHFFFRDPGGEMSERLGAIETTTGVYLINPHPAENKGLEVIFGLRGGAVGLRTVADPSVRFVLSPEAALALSSLIQLKVRADGYFSLAAEGR